MAKENKTGLYGLVAKVVSKLWTIIPKLLKGTKFIKFGLLAVSLGSYAYLYTWKFAILIIVSLWWHESFHLLGAKHMGIKTKGMYFIPLLGAVAVTEGNVKSYGQWSYVAVMGPIGGTILALACCGLYYITGIPMIAAAAGFMAFLNLFNLFPVTPLDGGQIMRAIAFSIHKNFGFVFLVLSLIVGTVVMFKLHIGLFAFLIVIGAIDLIVEFYRRRSIIRMHNAYMESSAEYSKYLNYQHSKIMQEWATARKEKYIIKAKEILGSVPISMNKYQIIASVASYTLTAAILIAIVKLMSHIPGADLAASFLAS